MTTCDGCGEMVRRRRRCWHCGQFVCGYCWHHEHACEPGHAKADCTDLAVLVRVKARHGEKAARNLLDRLRARSMAAEERRVEASA